MPETSLLLPIEQAKLVLGAWLNRLQHRRWRSHLAIERPDLWDKVFEAMNDLTVEADRIGVDPSLFRKLYDFRLKVDPHKDASPIVEIPDETWRQAAVVFRRIVRELEKENSPKPTDSFPPGEFVDPTTGKRADFSRSKLLWYLFRAIFTAGRRLKYAEIQERVPPWRGRSFDEETIPGAAKRLKTLLTNAGMKRHANAITQGGGTLCYALKSKKTVKSART